MILAPFIQYVTLQNLKYSTLDYENQLQNPNHLRYQIFFKSNTCQTPVSGLTTLSYIWIRTKPMPTVVKGIALPMKILAPSTLSYQKTKSLFEHIMQFMPNPTPNSGLMNTICHQKDYQHHQWTHHLQYQQQCCQYFPLVEDFSFGLYWKIELRMSDYIAIVIIICPSLANRDLDLKLCLKVSFLLFEFWLKLSFLLSR